MSPRRREAEPGPTAAAEVATDLRRRILEGELPPGTPLREADLAQRYQISRHTLRTALARLTAERLTQSEPYRGVRVTYLDDAAVTALQELRGALECEAVRILRARHGDQWPRNVTEQIETAIRDLAEVELATDWPRTVAVHSAVHRNLVAAAQSSRIAVAYNELDSEMRLLLAQIRPDYPPGTLAAEHQGYLDELQRRGETAVREHLAHSAELLRAGRAADSSLEAQRATTELGCGDLDPG